jgi:hypothetical protein
MEIVDAASVLPSLMPSVFRLAVDEDEQKILDF